MNFKQLERFVDSQEVSFLGSIDEDGFPNMKAMLKPKGRTGLKEFYFSTNTSSLRVQQYLKNSKATVYFYQKGLIKYQGLMLIGNMSVITDPEVKKEFWAVGDQMYYRQGVTDPDYCILKFTAIKGRYYCNLKTESFEV